MLLDSLRYWVTEMGVDGFRFDLVSTCSNERHHVDQNHLFKIAIREDPVLSQVKMIAEPWDLGPYGYQLGGFGHGWSEWNDRFRTYGTSGDKHSRAGRIAQRLTGSPDVFDRDGRATTASVNFISAHDGFTCVTSSPTTSSTTVRTASPTVTARRQPLLELRRRGRPTTRTSPPSGIGRRRI